MNDQLVSSGQDLECTQIKHFVVQRAHGNAVGYNVCAIDLKPLDARRLESDGLLTHAQVVTANSTAVLVGQQNADPKGRVTSAVWILGGTHGLKLRQTHRLQYITTNSVRKMRVHNALRQDADEFRVGL